MSHPSALRRITKNTDGSGATELGNRELRAVRVHGDPGRDPSRSCAGHPRARFRGISGRARRHRRVSSRAVECVAARVAASAAASSAGLLDERPPVTAPMPRAEQALRQIGRVCRRASGVLIRDLQQTQWRDRPLMRPATPKIRRSEDPKENGVYVGEGQACMARPSPREARSGQCAWLKSPPVPLPSRLPRRSPREIGFLRPALRKSACDLRARRSGAGYET